MITGYGVAESVKHFYNIWGGNLTNKKVVIQGWGNVASSAAYYLSQSGASIVGIIDKNSGQINENGFSFYCSTSKILSMTRFVSKTTKDKIPDVVSASIDE